MWIYQVNLTDKALFQLLKGGCLYLLDNQRG